MPSDRPTAEQALKTLLPKLHIRTIINWQEELEVGKPIYDALLSLLRSGRQSQQIEPGTLTPHQTANALVVIFQLRGHGSTAEVFAVVLEALGHSSRRVRDQAVALAIALMRQQRWDASYYNAETIDRLRAAVQAGLTKDAHAFAMRLLDHGPDAVDLR